MLAGRIFRMLGVGLVRRHCSVRCITALYRPPAVMGHFFALSRNAQLLRNVMVLACTSLQARPPKRDWPRKFEQVEKWSFCLIAPTMAANRRDHEQKIAPAPHTGVQGESGACHQQERLNVDSGTSAARG